MAEIILASAVVMCALSQICLYMAFRNMAKRLDNIRDQQRGSI